MSLFLKGDIIKEASVEVLAAGGMAAVGVAMERTLIGIPATFPGFGDFTLKRHKHVKNLSFWSSSCFLMRAFCSMAWVWTISSWGLGWRGTNGGRIVADWICEGEGLGPRGEGWIWGTRFTRETPAGCCCWGGGVGEAGFVMIVGLALRKFMIGSPVELRLSWLPACGEKESSTENIRAVSLTEQANNMGLHVHGWISLVDHAPMYGLLALLGGGMGLHARVGSTMESHATLLEGTGNVLKKYDQESRIFLLLTVIFGDSARFTWPACMREMSLLNLVISVLNLVISVLGDSMGLASPACIRLISLLKAVRNKYTCGETLPCGACGEGLCALLWSAASLDLCNSPSSSATVFTFPGTPVEQHIPDFKAKGERKLCRSNMELAEGDRGEGITGLREPFNSQTHPHQWLLSVDCSPDCETDARSHCPETCERSGFLRTPCLPSQGSPLVPDRLANTRSKAAICDGDFLGGWSASLVSGELDSFVSRLPFLSATLIPNPVKLPSWCSSVSDPTLSSATSSFLLSSRLFFRLPCPEESSTLSLSRLSRSNPCSSIAWCLVCQSAGFLGPEIEEWPAHYLPPSSHEKISEIEAEMARTQKNKATMGHLGLLKARLAKLKRELIEPKGGGGGTGEGFDVAKTGDARIGFVGFPSVGKSTLLSNLAGVYSEVAAYEFTTLTTVPGVIRYKGAKIQLLDLPGIIEGAKDGKGRGKQVIAVARTCNIIFIVLDVLKPLQHKRLIEYELEGFGIRLNKDPPNIGYKRKDKGGLNLTATVAQSELDHDLVKTILAEYKIHNADITLRGDYTTEDLIDVIEGNRIYVPAIYVLNKIDQISIEELDIIYKIPHCVPISAHHKWNFDDLLEMMWEYLRLVRLYTKPKGQLPDYTAPIILKDGKSSIEDFCNK
ncbi:128UP-like protein, partial [Mya arenaria]